MAETNKLRPKKSVGADSIPGYLGGSSVVLAESLCYLFNLSLSTYIFPQQWKEAHNFYFSIWCNGRLEKYCLLCRLTPLKRRLNIFFTVK